MSGTVRLENLIEKAHVKCREFDGGQELEAFGVSNTDGITRTAHRKSDDLGEYLVIEPGSFAYNPYRVNVGSIGLTPANVTGVVSPAYIVFRVKKQELIPEVLLDFLKSSEGLRQINKLARGTVRKALRYEDLCQIEFPAMSRERQLEVLKHKQGFNQQHGSLLSEITHQETLLAKLQQAILQEAIQGKLTADWRAAHPQTEPASQLLHRIQAEKARLIAAKQLRPEKPLPKITPEEIPFEVPKDWVWCRFGEVIRAYEAGSSFKCEDREVAGSEWGVIKTSAVTSGVFVERENKFLCSDAPDDTSAKVEIGDLIFCRASGSKGLAGMCAIVRECNRNLLLSDKTIRVPLMEGINQDYIALHNGSAQSKDFFNGLSTGKSTSMNNVTRGDLFKKPIPLPPFAEQAAIVARVETLLGSSRKLAAEIAHTRTHAAYLLQSVLKEAFTPAAA